MRRRGFLALLPALLIALGPGVAVAQEAGVSVELDRTEVSRQLGQTVAFTSTLRNTSPTPLTGVVAHLNVVSLDPGVYVDPEDWSSSRTRYLGTIAPGGEKTVRWSVKAVTGGNHVLYVTAIPADGSESIAVSPPMHFRVTERRTLNPGGVLPLVVAIPGVLLAAAVARRVMLLRRVR
jgi:hypothetical protein